MRKPNVHLINIDTDTLELLKELLFFSQYEVTVIDPGLHTSELGANSCAVITQYFGSEDSHFYDTVLKLLRKGFQGNIIVVSTHDELPEEFQYLGIEFVRMPFTIPAILGKIKIPIS